MANKKIVFSHKDYLKFRNTPPDRAYLIAIKVIDSVDNIPMELLKYDITFEGGKYQLDRTSKYIALFLFDPDNNNLFMTLRKYTDNKLSYYEDGINTMFRIKYSRFAKKSDIFGG